MEQAIEQEIGVDHRPLIGSSEALWAALAYLGVLVFLPFSLSAKTEFIKHHVRQGLILLSAEIVMTFIFVVPLGWIIGIIGWLACEIFSLVGLVMALRKKYWLLPIFSKLAQKIKLT